jgi:hypothetical protein
VDAGISKPEVSRICADLDADVAVFQGRELTEQAFPYVFVDATYCKARVAGRVVSQAAVIATGVSADERREVLGSAVGDSETQDFWTEFLRGLRERGLHGVQLMISDHHRGLMNAIDAVMVGASWQRCRVHYAEPDVGVSQERLGRGSKRCCTACSTRSPPPPSSSSTTSCSTRCSTPCRRCTRTSGLREMLVGVTGIERVTSSS